LDGDSCILRNDILELIEPPFIEKTNMKYIFKISRNINFIRKKIIDFVIIDFMNYTDFIIAEIA
jgi:hypothetical protein